MPKIALLIDADNANAKHIDKVITTLENEGNLCERHIFGDWSSPHLSGWNDAILRHALKQSQQNAYTKTKNATDIALVICAMDLLYTKEIDTFAIMSSDSDFTPLVQRLRQAGKVVWGFVNNQAFAAFCKACDKCVILQNTSTTPNQKQDKLLDKKIYQRIDEIMNTAEKVEGFVKIGDVDRSLKAQGLDAKDYGHKSFMHLICESGLYHCKTIENHLHIAKKKPTAVGQNSTKQDLFGAAITAFDECIVAGLGENYVSAADIGNKLSQKNIPYHTHFEKLRLLLDAVPNLEGKFVVDLNNYAYQLKQLPNQPFIPRRTAEKIMYAFHSLDAKDGVVAIEALAAKLHKEKIDFKTLGFKKFHDLIIAIRWLYLIEKQKNGVPIRYITDKKEIYDQWQKKSLNTAPTATPQATQTPLELESEPKDTPSAPTVPHTKEQLRVCPTLVAAIKSAIQESKNAQGRANPEHVFILMAKTINPQDYGYATCKELYLAIR